jgi:hypothetical protein
MNRQPPSLVVRTAHRIRRPRPGQQLGQPVGEASNESTKVGGEGSIGGGNEAGSRSATGAVGPGGGGAASQKGRPAGRAAKDGKRREELKTEKKGRPRG